MNSGCRAYAILTTCPPYGSRNVGDLLIEQRTRELVRNEKGPCDFLTVFREESLENRLEEINRCRAVLLPGFPVRDLPMFPGVYKLVENPDRIRPPLVPIGANWNRYPGDALSRTTVSYSEPTVTFLRRVAAQVREMSCREYFTCDVLARHGIENTVMTGDPAWFWLGALGHPMRRPARIDTLVFSPPLSPFYADQACEVLAMLSKRFPAAERLCAFHLFDADTAPRSETRHENSAAMTDAVTAKNRVIRRQARRHGFQIVEMAGALANLDRYQTCDLHVGYECHAHLNFFSRRIPSLLIAEDARGVGFNDTLGVGGFDGFRRVSRQEPTTGKRVTSGYCTSREELEVAVPREDLAERLDEFLAHECESRFRRYLGLSARLDEIYAERMRPFLRALP